MVAFEEMDTIVAAATPPGQGALAILRLSGESSWEICSGVVRFRGLGQKRPQPWKAYLGQVFVDGGDRSIDQVVAVFYAAPKSYTGQDMVELTCHGNPHVLERLVEEAVSLGARPANRGEFTLRAYLGGKMDLSQAEAVDAMIRAGSLAEVLNAQKSITGAPSKRIAAIGERIEEWLARLEAAIEFPEVLEEDGSPHLIDPKKIVGLERRLSALGRAYRRAQRLGSGVRVTLAGRANVGKSSIFNRLLRQKRSIVTPVPGTTRDVVQAEYHAGGVRMTLFDTAGMKAVRGEPDRAGILHSRQAQRLADMLLVVVDAGRPLKSGDRELVARAIEGPHLVLINKADLGGVAVHEKRLASWGVDDPLPVSAKTGRGFKELNRRLARIGGEIWRSESGDGADFHMNLRQKRVLDAAGKRLAVARKLLTDGAGEELAAQALREALEALGGFGGTAIAERVLNRIFDNFCVGK